ncbi:hypothetical protein [Micromonospora rosaria]|uniref:hypothetical protein n=1 Tax=Micromonospora rosaria TaxID=47874 RepID=UPI0012FB6DEE|nr:hypothetical protein [Micromonospora rosaria]
MMMAEVRVRRFVVSAPPPGVPVAAGDVEFIDSGPFELNLADVLRVNALAVPYRGYLLTDLVQHEMSLVMSLFGHTPPGAALRRHEAFDGSSSHIQRFVTEVLALGALTAVVRDEDPKLSKVAHFDALPLELQRVYPSSGIRPDLRFAGQDAVLAGEARGRSRPPPQTVLTSTAQRHRLDQLLDWSRRPGCDPVAMAWSWMQESRTTIDFFRFGEDAAAPSADPAVVHRLEQTFRDTDPTPDEFTEKYMNAAVHGIWTSTTGKAREQTAKQRIIDRTMEDREDQLLETAPRQSVSGMSSRWRGRWRDAPTIAGVPGPRLLLAVSPEREGRATNTADGSRLYRSREIGLEVSAAGRVLVALDWRKRSEIEAGKAVERELEATDQ